MFEFLEQNTTEVVTQVDSLEYVTKERINIDELLKNLPLSKFLRMNNLDSVTKKDALTARLIAAAKNPGDTAEGSKSRSVEQKNFFLYHTVINNWLFGKTNDELKPWSIILRSPSKEPELYADLDVLENDIRRLRENYKLQIKKIHVNLRKQLDLIKDTWVILLPPLNKKEQENLDKAINEYGKSVESFTKSLINNEARQWWVWPLSWWK
jgi:hypothetical protein